MCMKRREKFKEKYGPYALVAGGSEGLGFAFAESIARRGLDLVIIARKEERLKAAAAKLKQAYGVDVIVIAADMANFEKVKKAIEALHISIGLLIYNAAYAPIGYFETLSDDQLALAAEVNVKTPLRLAKLLTVPMIEQKRGGILLMSSLSGGQGSAKVATYAATKAFNTILAEGLWKELKPHGIDVIACVAGAIITPGYQKAEKGRPAPGVMEATNVAETALNALGRGPIVIPGIINKIGRFVLTRILGKKNCD